MDTFEVNPKSLKLLLASIHERELALPDFQRDFVWQPRDTEALVESISQAFPAGSLLFMPFRSGTFTPREVKNAPPLQGSPLQLVLDGQQRLTSLYQAFYGPGEYLYFIDFNHLIGDTADIEEAIFYRHRSKAKHYSLPAQQVKLLVMPLSEVFGGAGFETWLDGILEARGSKEERANLRQALRAAHERFIKPIEEYRFPVITLDHRTKLEAVCSIFETLNRTGVRLSVFELLAARFFAQELDLRAMWQTTLDEHPILDEYDVSEYYVLQAIALRVKNSVKRGDVLDLTKEEILDQWPGVTRGFARALDMLRTQCGVLTAKWVPYGYMLVPLAGLWQDVIEVAGPAAGANRERLRRWFWCSALNARYDRAANTQAAKDFNELRRWLSGGQQPDSINEFAFDAPRLRTITPRQQAVYKALMALVVSSGALDFHQGSPLTKESMDAHGVDDHHVFPKAYLNPAGEPPKHETELVDCILNRTLIDRATNIRIGKRAPSDYLADIRKKLDALPPLGPQTRFSRLLSSHLLPASEDAALLNDDFAGFLAARSAALVERIEAATGTSVAAAQDEIGENELDAVA
jgi:hypothetical protein